MLFGDYFGKITLLHHCASGNEPKSGLEVSNKDVLIDNTEVTLQIWDKVEKL